MLRLPNLNLCVCGVPASCEQVSHPLDFSTIKKRQKRGNYSKQGFSKLWEDISTVYRNAQLYNQVGRPVIFRFGHSGDLSTALVLRSHLSELRRMAFDTGDHHPSRL